MNSRRKSKSPAKEERLIRFWVNKQDIFDLDTLLAREIRAIKASGGLEKWLDRLEDLKRRVRDL